MGDNVDEVWRTLPSTSTNEDECKEPLAKGRWSIAEAKTSDPLVKKLLNLENYLLAEKDILAKSLQRVRFS